MADRDLTPFAAVDLEGDEAAQLRAIAEFQGVPLNEDGTPQETLPGVHGAFDSQSLEG